MYWMVVVKKASCLYHGNNVLLIFGFTSTCRRYLRGRLIAAMTINVNVEYKGMP